MAVQDIFRVSRPRDFNATELDRFALEVDDKLRLISEKLAQLEGQRGRTAKHEGTIDMQLNSITGLPSAHGPTDAVPLMDLESKALTKNAIGIYEADAAIKLPLSSDGADPYSAVSRNDLTTAIDSILRDRLITYSASPSTLILSDDGTDQTLTGSLGNLKIDSAGYIFPQVDIKSDYKLTAPSIGDSKNTFFGIGSCSQNLVETNPGDGCYNTTFGWYAGNAITSGASNALFGDRAGERITTGDANMYFGATAGYYTTTGEANTGVGGYTLFNNSTGGYNACVGAFGLFGLTSGGNNTTLGSLIYQADGGGNITNLNNSIHIGNGAKASAVSGVTNEIAIGYAAIGKGSNTTAIGNSSTTDAYLYGSTAHFGTTASQPSVAHVGDTNAFGSPALGGFKTFIDSGDYTDVGIWDVSGGPNYGNVLMQSNTNASMWGSVIFQRDSRSGFGGMGMSTVLMDEDFSANVFGGTTRFALYDSRFDSTSATPFVNFAPATNGTSGPANIVSALLTPGAAQEVNALVGYAITQPTASPASTSIGVDFQNTYDSSETIGELAGARFFSKTGDSTGDITYLYGGIFRSEMLGTAGGAYTGTVTNVIPVVSFPAIYPGTTAPGNIIGFQYRRDGVSVAPSGLHIASKFEADSMWTNDYGLLFGNGSNYRVDFDSATGNLDIVGDKVNISNDLDIGGDLGLVTDKKIWFGTSQLVAIWNDGTSDEILFEPGASANNPVTLTSYGTGGLMVSESGSKIGFLGTTPIALTAAMTAQLTTITHTAPGTSDYAIQDMVDVAGDGSQGWSFADHDEANTVLAVIANLQTRLSEAETKLIAYGLFQ